MRMTQGFLPASRELSKRYLRSLSDYRKIDRYDLLIIFGISLYVSILSYLSILKLNTFQSEYDLAVFNQALWNTAMHGELLTNALEYGSHFSVHFSPILFTLVPIYGLFPEPVTLLIIQSILLSLGAVPVYLCGREILGKEAGCIVGFSYLLYPSLHGVNLYDFHEIAFLPLLLGMAFWGFLSGRKNLVLIFGIMALLVKEDVSLLTGMMGLIGLYQTRTYSITDRWQYIVLLVLSFLSLSVFLLIIKPFFASFGAGTAPEFLSQYVDPLNTVMKHNSYTIRLEYIIKSFAPLLFVPLLAPELLLISGPSFIEILFSGGVFYSVWYHYSALIIPGILFSTILGLSRIQSREETFGKQIFRPILLLMLISSILCCLLYSPAVKQGELVGGFDEKALEKHREYVVQLISVLPFEASISTQINLLPYVSTHRTYWADYHDGADIILLDNAFSWRSKDFRDDAERIQKNYVLLMNENYVELYVNKLNPQLLSELRKTLQKENSRNTEMV